MAESVEEYALVGGKRLRRGYTTGSCAAAAAKAAARLLFFGEVCQMVELILPGGEQLIVEVLDHTRGEGFARCAVCKDAGDDPDITNGAQVCATVFCAAQGVTVDGGKGVGRITKPGLEFAVGEAAINRVPRQMIAEAVQEELDKLPSPSGARVEISIPEGEQLAKKTYNPRLGIMGGLSVLGTTGIVEPMSEQALVESIRLEMNILKKTGTTNLAVTPGHYGRDFARNRMGLDLSDAVLCSNFVGETLDSAAAFGFRRILLVGHLGKMVKLAGGIFQTHSHVADARMEILTAHAALCGADHETLSRLMECITTDHALDVLGSLRAPVMQAVIAKIDKHLRARAGEGVQIGAVVFSNQYGLLGQTEHAERLLGLFRPKQEKGPHGDGPAAGETE